jgi:peptidoglycan/LPS O-acetylase OafA/YrhL
MHYRNKLFIFIFATVISFLIAITSLFSNSTPPPHWPAILYFVLGIVFLALAVREFRGKTP